MSTFSVGQLVVCTMGIYRSSPEWLARTPNRPCLNVIYEIREVEVPDAEGISGVLLSEIKNPTSQFRDGFREPAFDERRFRAVQPTSIEWAHNLVRCRPYIDSAKNEETLDEIIFNYFWNKEQ